MKFVNSFFLAAMVLLLAMASCSEYSNKPGKAYMPDMAYTTSYKYYSKNPNFKNNMTAQAPVAGTMARGASLPDHISEFDTTAAKAHTYSGTLSMVDVEEGGRLYNIQCAVCHGNGLDGNGPLYNGGNGKYPAAPANFKDAKYLNMPVGTMYHAIMYGKNLMGAYSSQLDAKQRWMVLAYIKSEQAKNGGSPLSTYFTIAEPDVATTTGAPIAEANHNAAKHDEAKHEGAATEVKHDAKDAAAHEAKSEKATEVKKTEVKKAGQEVKAVDSKAPSATKTNNH
jgi:mono/diheme cytochrome c family protein